MIARDITFRQLNKEVILIIIGELIKPKEKNPLLKRNSIKINSAYSVLHFISSIIYPETTAVQRKLYDEWRNQPEKRRQEELHIASTILDNISHSRRSDYLEDVLKKGLGAANSDWEHRKNKWKVVRDN